MNRFSSKAISLRHKFLRKLTCYLDNLLYTLFRSSCVVLQLIEMYKTFSECQRISLLNISRLIVFAKNVYRLVVNLPSYPTVWLFSWLYYISSHIVINNVRAFVLRCQVSYLPLHQHNVTWETVSHYYRSILSNVLSVIKVPFTCVYSVQKTRYHNEIVLNIIPKKIIYRWWWWYGQTRRNRHFFK